MELLAIGVLGERLSWQADFVAHGFDGIRISGQAYLWASRILAMVNSGVVQISHGKVKHANFRRLASVGPGP